MKKTAFLVNTGRGGLVNEPDLIEALRSGVISGAGAWVLVVVRVVVMLALAVMVVVVVVVVDGWVGGWWWMLDSGGWVVGRFLARSLRPSVAACALLALP